MYAKRKTVMPDTITMINLVWSAMIAVMMTATFTLYQGKPDSPQYNYTQMTGQYLEQPYYLGLKLAGTGANAMYVAMIVLCGLISTMFVASVVTSISELRRERENLRAFARRHAAF